MVGVLWGSSRRPQLVTRRVVRERKDAARRLAHAVRFGWFDRDELLRCFDPELRRAVELVRAMSPDADLPTAPREL